MVTRLAAAVVAAVVVAVALSFVSTEVLEAQSGRCYVGAHFYNKDRQVARGGYIDAECPGSVHSAPFGNWGVQAPHSRIRNAN